MYLICFSFGCGGEFGIFSGKISAKVFASRSRLGAFCHKFGKANGRSIAIRER